MKVFRLACVVILVAPFVCFAQKKEYVQLERDVASLQEKVDSLQQSLSENTGKIMALLQQTIDGINKVNTNIAVMDAAMRDRERTLSAPVAGVGAKIDQMAAEFQNLRASVDDLNSRMGKLERTIVDLGNTIKVIQSPPAPPAPGGAAASPPQGVSAEALYANAMRDKDSGNYDVALQEFSDYLKFYGNTDTAPNAQYYIGEIDFSRKDYDNALKAFDMVLERYPENNKTLDSMYMKGLTLVRMGQRTKGAAEFREVIRRQPRSDLASKAKAQLNSLGLPLSAPSKRAAPHSRS